MNNRFVEFFRLLKQLWRQGFRLAWLSFIEKIGRMVSGRSSWQHSRLTPKIILGGQPARRILPELAAAGVTGIINMRKEYDYADEIGNIKLDYLYLPTKDNTAPSLEALHQGVEFICKHLDSGSVYIHCWEGLGRGPSMAAAYFVSEGSTPDEAWQKIRLIRPFIRPTYSQIKQIEAFAEALKAKPIESTPPAEEVVVAEIVTEEAQPDMPPQINQ